MLKLGIQGRMRILNLHRQGFLFHELRFNKKGELPNLFLSIPSITSSYLPLTSAKYTERIKTIIMSEGLDVVLVISQAQWSYAALHCC